MKQDLNKTEKECIVIFGGISGLENPDDSTSDVDIAPTRFLTEEEINEILNTKNQYKAEKS